MKCPYCSNDMAQVYILIGGGVWFSDSLDQMARHLRFVTTGIPPSEPAAQRGAPIRCMIGKLGYRGAGDWPIPGWFCSSYNCLVFQTKHARKRADQKRPDELTDEPG